jgi:NADH-quinone oxidoreductase subunit A
MDNSLQAHFPILIQLLIGAALPVLILVASHLFGQRPHKQNRTAAKDEPYECGIADTDKLELGAPDTAAPASAPTHPRFAIKFHVVAMLFILFDIAALFLIPWALGFRELVARHVAVAVPSGAFVGLLAFGLFYQLKKGALEWERPKPNNPPPCK